MLLKSSDFVLLDLDPVRVFEGCEVDEGQETGYELELVMRKWYPMDRGREMRCFVRQGMLIGMSIFQTIRHHSVHFVATQAFRSVIPTTTTSSTHRTLNPRSLIQ